VRDPISNISEIETLGLASFFHCTLSATVVKVVFTGTNAVAVTVMVYVAVGVPLL
jgi:hypothetical protein